MKPLVERVKWVFSHSCTSAINFFLIIKIGVKRRPPQIWIGDSHINYFANFGSKLQKHSLHNNQSGLIIWVGPKLLYTVSKKGFQFDLLSKFLLLMLGDKQKVIISLGEIVCRVHLVPKTLHLGAEAFEQIASNFKTEIMKMISKYDLGTPIILTPVPPSDFGLAESVFPWSGDISKRILVTNFLREALMLLNSDSFKVLDLNTLLADESGKLKRHLSDDGIHVNALGSKKVSGLIFDLL